MTGTTMGTMATTTDPERPGPTAHTRPRFLAGLRSRILLWYVALLAAAITLSIVVVHRVITIRVDERIDQDLVQETREIGVLATRGIDPETGRPFRGDVARIFEVFLERNIPHDGEAYITFVRGQPHLRRPQVLPYRLDLDPRLVALWRDVREPVRGRVETPAGEIDYLALPLKVENETRGVFVDAIFREQALEPVGPALTGTMVVGVVTLLLGSLLAWRVAEGVLRPVRVVTDTARSISETDLHSRITVEGEDEISHLATTFNEMLDRLQEAFATQRRFVNDAGHELRTPITVIRGHLELLEDDPEERAKTIALVTDELDRMNRFVNDLLVLAKAEQPDFLNLQTVDMEALTTEVHTKAEALGDRDWRLERVARGSIVADRQRLTQALMQLAQNAAQHTGDGEEIVIGSALAGGEARMWVRDTGPGISQEEQEQIFQRFARAGIRRSSDGAGLGLAIVRAIADAHHGRVELRSSPGAGATFTLVLPADQPVTEVDR